MPLLEDLHRVELLIDAAVEEQMNDDAEVKAVEEKIAAHKEAIRSIEEAMAYPRVVGAADHFFTALDTRNSWRTGLNDLGKRQSNAARPLKDATRQLEEHRANWQRIQTTIDAQAAVLARAKMRINGSRQDALDEIHRRSHRGRQS